MKLFAAFFAASLAQDFNETDSRMLGQQGSAIDGCQGPLCEAAVQDILDATADLHLRQEQATTTHEEERAESQAEQQAIQAAFEEVSENLIFHFCDFFIEQAFQKNYHFLKIGPS